MIRLRKLLYFTTIISVVIICLSWYSTASANSFSLDDNTGVHIPETGYALYIDLEAYTMTVYRNGQVYKTLPVSGGTKETPSPVGTWYVTEISDWGEGFGGM